MGRLFFILAFICPALSIAQTQSLTVDDLLSLSSLSSQNFDNYIVKKGFRVKRRSIVENTMGYTFYQNRTTLGADSLPIIRYVNLYKKDDAWCISLHTSSPDEYIDGRNRLKKMNFYSDAGNDTNINVPLLFQKKAVTVQSSCPIENGSPDYTFILKKKEIPDPASIQYAEDLLKFDSHEYLVGCFGEKNVKKDVYIFSDTELKQCSILFPNR